MRSRYKFTEPGNYFLTATIVEWLPVFQGVEPCNIIVDALEFCRQNKEMKLRAYVIMENHIHLIAEAPDLSTTIQSFKSYTARQIISHMTNSNKEWLHRLFTLYKKRYKHDSTYQVWQEGVHPQRIQGAEMLTQKMTYIHQNPVRRGYVDLPEHWRYSSARNYLLDPHVVLDVDFPEC